MKINFVFSCVVVGGASLNSFDDICFFTGELRAARLITRTCRVNWAAGGRTAREALMTLCRRKFCLSSPDHPPEESKKNPIVRKSDGESFSLREGVFSGNKVTMKKATRKENGTKKTGDKVLSKGSKPRKRK
jgi:hypothetical protein